MQMSEAREATSQMRWAYLLGREPAGSKTSQGQGHSAGDEREKLHLLLPITPHRSHYSMNHPSHPIPGKFVFQETGPWCQKDWGLLS